MVDFKAHADSIIKERWGLEVEHFFAVDKEGQKQTYDSRFYSRFENAKHPLHKDQIYGFPVRMGAWCNSRLKVSVLNRIASQTKGSIRYIGIASDEPNRFHTLNGASKISPLVEIGWTEADCKQWCSDNELLSPIYLDSSRGGCWFCHNQPVSELRRLRKNYPEYWKLLLKWDLDSPVPFHPDGHTVHDFDKRFQLEDEGLIDPKERFRWAMLHEELNFNLFTNQL